MRIGIAAPISVLSLKKHLINLTPEDLILGLGGAAVNTIIDGLINDGHQVIVFTLDSNVRVKHVLQGPNLKIIFGHYRISLIKTFDFCRKEFLQIKKFIELEKDNVDIVNAHWTYEFSIGTILANVNHLITFRDDSPTILKLTKHPYRLSRLIMDFWVRKNGKCFSYNSPYLKSLINIDGEIIPNPIKNSEILSARLYPTNRKVIKICYVSNGWNYRKNPEIAIMAFAQVYKMYPNIELHLIGNGFEENGKGFCQMDKLRLNNNVIYRGNMPHSKFMSVLQEFDVMIHTAREESFGNNIIEAMAKGIPVLGGIRSGAVPWVIGKEGCLADIENVNDVSEKLAKIISDKEYYEYLSMKGIQNITLRFSQKIVGKKYIMAYLNALDKCN